MAHDVVIDGELDLIVQLDGELDLIVQLDGEPQNITEIKTDDHRKLTHRDAADQHPISAITDLEAELNVRPSSALTNQDIQNILNT